MPLTLKEVEYVAKLAHLEISQEQLTRYREQLEAILDHVAKLQELDTNNVAPTTSISPGEMSLRQDKPYPGLSKDNTLKNTESQENGQFMIPPIFD